MNPIGRYSQYIMFALAVALVVTGLETEALVAAAGGLAIAARQIWKRWKQEREGRDD